MSDPGWAGGRVGRIGDGQYRGMYVQVEEDGSRSGFHIWLTERHPDEGSSRGWDIWADTAEDVEDWLSSELRPVEWLG